MYGVFLLKDGRAAGLSVFERISRQLIPPWKEQQSALSNRNRRFALGLGGNTGDVRGSLQRCVAALSADSRIKCLEVSSLYRTPPWGNVEGGEFLNAAVCGAWTGADIELLCLCRSIEIESGSPVRKEGGARQLDVDVLFLEGGVSSRELTLPHPRMSLRRFVLVPLGEIWQETVPGMSETPMELLKQVQDDSSIIFGGQLYQG